MTGSFVAVAGPSGSGKDTLIAWAREALGERGDVVFSRRAITRPSGPGEDHEPLSDDEFAAVERAGGFALTWGAHGLRYGIPAAVRDDLARGAVVVANVSRGSLADVRERFDRAVVVHVTVSPEVRLERILARGREDRAQAEARIARVAPPVEGAIEIRNDGSVADGGAQLRDVLEAERDRLVGVR